MINYNEYLGRGIKFPIQVTNGNPVLTLGVALIEQSIKRILSTPIGSTFMLRSFGSRLHRLKGKPLNIVTENLLDIAIREALNKWEKRIRVEAINFQSDRDVVNCFIQYKVLASNEIETYVYPFYNEVQL